MCSVRLLIVLFPPIFYLIESKIAMFLQDLSQKNERKGCRAKTGESKQRELGHIKGRNKEEQRIKACQSHFFLSKMDHSIHFRGGKSIPFMIFVFTYYLKEETLWLCD